VTGQTVNVCFCRDCALDSKWPQAATAVSGQCIDVRGTKARREERHARDIAGAAYAKTHIRSVKSVIYAVFRFCYIEVVQTDGPAPPGFLTKTTRYAP
jgi:hypothetical protein